jgi:hypothetical protein
MRKLAIPVLAGSVVGTFLAALPYAQNNACLHTDAVQDERAYFSDVGGWPYGTHCEWAGGSESFAASVPETLGWILVATLIFSAALLRRSAPARGAALAAIELALIGWGWHYGGEIAGVGMFVLTFGFLIAYAADRWLRRGGRRIGSLLTAVILTPTVLFLWFLPSGFDLEHLAVAIGLVVGACVTTLRPFSPEPLPAR